MLRGADEMLARLQCDYGRERWDILFCSDMLDLASFRLKAPALLRDMPTTLYFHENQLTYPIPDTARREVKFSRINVRSAMAADQVWFNTEYHRKVFFEAARSFCKREPELGPVEKLEEVFLRSAVHPQGLEPIVRGETRADGPLHLLWAARWEHDKQPELFFEALRGLRAKGVDFRLSVVGGRPMGRMACLFDDARVEFEEAIENWGWQDTRADYLRILGSSDVVVSTAKHEFFGVSVLEAVAAGAFPLVPERLAYPEVLDAESNPDFFYDGSLSALIDKLAELARRKESSPIWGADSERGVRIAKKFFWTNIVSSLDQALCPL